MIFLWFPKNLKNLNSLKERKQNVLFNDVLNIFHLQLYGTGNMVKDHLEKKPATATTWATYSD